MTASNADRDKTGDRRMSSLSLVLALAFVLAASSMAGQPAARLPGIGTFAYNGSPIVTQTPQVIVVVSR
jgi:hypothetical protein